MKLSQMVVKKKVPAPVKVDLFPGFTVARSEGEWADLSCDACGEVVRVDATDGTMDAHKYHRCPPPDGYADVTSEFPTRDPSLGLTTVLVRFDPSNRTSVHTVEIRDIGPDATPTSPQHSVHLVVRSVGGQADFSRLLAWLAENRQQLGEHVASIDAKTAPKKKEKRK